MKKLIKNIFLITLLLLIQPNFYSPIAPSNASTKQNNSLGLIARINNISIGNIYNEMFNLSVEFDIVNQNTADVQYQASNSCGFPLSVNMTSVEINNPSLFVNDNCQSTPTTFTYKPGSTFQEITQLSIGIYNWPPNNINDLPIAQYTLNIDHSNFFNMTTWGATISYTGTGQFSIQFAQNSLNAWGTPANNYQESVPNTFTRDSTIGVSGISSNNISILFLLIVGVLVIVAVVGIVAYNRRRKAELIKEQGNKVKKLSVDGTFQRVVLERTCPVCGNTLTETDVFCANCGNRTN